MPVTENSLRDLLRERSAHVPPTPELAQRVQHRVRRRRRLEASGIAAALALVLVGTGLVALPHRDAAGPSSTPRPTPTTSAATTRTTQVLGLTLVVTTEGPTRIDGSAPFDVEVQVSNTAATTWRGDIGVGVLTDAAVPGMYRDPLIRGAEPLAVRGPAAVRDETSPQQLQGAVRRDVELRPGEVFSQAFSLARLPHQSVRGQVLGWIPWTSRAGSETDPQMGDPAQAVPLVVTPQDADLACSTVTVTSTSVGRPGEWQITSVATGVIAPPGGSARWAPSTVPAGAGTTVDAGATPVTDYRDSTVVAAIRAHLADIGDRTPLYVASEPVNVELSQTPGTYVKYSAAQLVPVQFEGTCGPSGQAISGVWKAYGETRTGTLECGIAPTSDGPDAKALEFCPR